MTRAMTNVDTLTVKSDEKNKNDGSNNNSLIHDRKSNMKIQITMDKLSGSPHGTI